ncbi:MAG: sulfur relay protein DsrC [Gammaproteobacteria bacterium]|nr:sulfur relay protein DsrC [Gammaproteobacteria bacterium]
MIEEPLDLSAIIIQNPTVNSFVALKEIISEYATGEVVLLNFDVKPDYRDTPRDWQWQLEGAFMQPPK